MQLWVIPLVVFALVPQATAGLIPQTTAGLIPQVKFVKLSSLLVRLQEPELTLSPLLLEVN